METFLSPAIVLAWFAIVVWGIVDLLIHAKRTNDWEKVGIAALSATTVAGPLLTFIPERGLFGGHTVGLGFVLAIMSAVAILVSCVAFHRRSADAA